MPRILLVDDGEAAARPLVDGLRQDGHEVRTAACVVDAVEIASRDRPDLVLLEPLVPGASGLEAMTALGRAGAADEIPIMIVSFRVAEIDRVLAFELGAVDYVAKPYSVRELVLRVRAVLRRGALPRPRARGVVTGCLRIDQAGHRAWAVGRELDLTLLEWKLLVALFECRGRVISRRTLLEDVWCDVAVTPRTVDTHVKRLREKLGIAGAYVQTVRGVGYRFCEESTVSEEA